MNYSSFFDSVIEFALFWRPGNLFFTNQNLVLVRRPSDRTAVGMSFSNYFADIF